MGTEKGTGNGIYRTLLVSALTLIIGMVGGYVARRSEATPGYTTVEIDRRFEEIQTTALEYRRDVAQINSRIASIDSKVAVIESKISRKGE